MAKKANESINNPTIQGFSAGDVGRFSAYNPSRSVDDTLSVCVMSRCVSVVNISITELSLLLLSPYNVIGLSIIDDKVSLIDKLLVASDVLGVVWLIDGVVISYFSTAIFPKDESHSAMLSSAAITSSGVCATCHRCACMSRMKR
jgi:hypothetical protein